ncbi:hypothetical protein DFH06DRAFT_1123052 [Mycena polygramma]|nr:hypothetical protein DFH06DRAFT_1123052 [Mycena polygramma]
MSTCSKAYVSSLPHPGPPPTCPLPPLPATKAIMERKASHPVVESRSPTLPLKRLIPAGPMNAPKCKRAVFKTLTNIADRVRLPRRRKSMVDVMKWSSRLFCWRDSSGSNSSQRGDTHGGEAAPLVGFASAFVPLVGDLVCEGKRRSFGFWGIHKLGSGGRW